MKNVLFFSILFCTITLPVFGQLKQTDLDKIRLIINDEIKKESSSSEMRMKEHVSQEIKTVNVKISEMDKRLKEHVSQEIKTVNVKISEMDKRLNMLFGIVIALIAIVGIPQIIVAWRSSKYKELENKIDHLTQEIQTLKQQRIVSS